MQISEETNQLSSEEDLITYNINNYSNSHSDSTNSVNNGDATNTSNKKTHVELGSIKTTKSEAMLVSMTKSELVPVCDQNDPLNEIVVTSTETDPTFSAGVQIPLSSVSKQSVVASLPIDPKMSA